MFSSFTHYNLSDILIKLHHTSFSLEDCNERMVRPYCDAPSVAGFLAYVCHFFKEIAEHYSAIQIADYSDHEKTFFIVGRIVCLSRHYDITPQKLGFGRLFVRGFWRFEWDLYTPQQWSNPLLTKYTTWCVPSLFLADYVRPVNIHDDDVVISEEIFEEEVSLTVFENILNLTGSGEMKDDVVFAMLEKKHEDDAQDVNGWKIDELVPIVDEKEQQGRERFRQDLTEFLDVTYDCSSEKAEGFLDIVCDDKFIHYLVEANASDSAFQQLIMKKMKSSQGSRYFYRSYGWMPDLPDRKAVYTIMGNFLLKTAELYPALSRLIPHSVGWEKIISKKSRVRLRPLFVVENNVSDYFIFSLILSWCKSRDIRQMRDVFLHCFSGDEFDVVYEDITSDALCYLSEVIIDASILFDTDEKGRTVCEGAKEFIEKLWNMDRDVSFLAFKGDKLKELVEDDLRFTIYDKQQFYEKQLEEKGEHFMNDALVIACCDPVFCARALYCPCEVDYGWLYNQFEAMLDRAFSCYEVWYDDTGPPSDESDYEQVYSDHRSYDEESQSWDEDERVHTLECRYCDWQKPLTGPEKEDFDLWDVGHVCPRQYDVDDW